MPRGVSSELTSKRKQIAKVAKARGSLTHVGLLSVEELPSSCEVSLIGGKLDQTERETAISWLDSDKYAEVTTANGPYMKTLERLGYIPESVDILESGDIRMYRIPRRYLGKPRRPRKDVGQARKVRNSKEINGEEG